MLEVLVALAIAALTLGVLLNLFAGASRSARLNQDYRQALQLAESKLDEIASAPLHWLEPQQGSYPLGDSTPTEQSHYRWKSLVTPYQRETAGALQYPLQLYHIQIDVSWGERQDYPVSLTTLRLGERS